MKKPYIEHQKIHPLTITQGGKVLGVYKPAESSKTITIPEGQKNEEVLQGLTKEEMMGIITPVIAENYADAVTQLTPNSYLYNPAFANDAEGWTIPVSEDGVERVTVKASDYKNRLFIEGGGIIWQPAENMQKPSQHEEYTFTPLSEEEEEGEETEDTTTPEEEPEFTPSEFLSDQPEWEEIPDPTKMEGKEEKQDTLYLSVSFICHAKGILEIGFTGIEDPADGAMLMSYVSMEESADIQTFTTSGTWDGTGYFEIQMAGGKIEITNLSLTDKPLEEYRTQTDSALHQCRENIGYIYQALDMEIKRLESIQEHLKQLYFNDTTIKEWIDQINGTLTEHTERLDGIDTSLNAHSTAIKNNTEEIASIQGQLTTINTMLAGFRTEIDDIKTSITGLGTNISGINTSIDALDKRITALESASSPTT